jgi:hypothetical protein
VKNQYSRRVFIIVNATTDDRSEKTFCLVDASEQGFNSNDRNYAIAIVAEDGRHHCLTKQDGGINFI